MESLRVACASSPRPGERAALYDTIAMVEAEGVDICMICLDGCACDSEGGMTRLPCTHAFHTMCILTAYTYTPSCPVCRGSRIEKESAGASDERTLLTIQTTDMTSWNDEMIQWRRSNRRYRNLLNRLEKRDECAIRYRCNYERSRTASSACEAAYESVYMKKHEELLHLLCNDQQVIEARKSMQRCKRSHARFARIRTQYTEHQIGAPPVRPLRGVDIGVDIGEFIDSRRNRLSELIANALNAVVTEANDDPGQVVMSIQ